MADFHHPKLRLLKGDELTHQELDNNINSFYYSSSLDGSNIKLYAGSTSGSFSGYTQSYDVNAFTASHAVSASYISTASYALFAISSSVEVTLEHSSSYAESASFADSSNNALSASHFANGVISASVNLNTLTLRKADNSTLSYLIHTGSGEANPDGIISSSAQIKLFTANSILSGSNILSSSAQIALLNAGIVSASAQIRDRLVSATSYGSASNAIIRNTLGTNQFILSGSKPNASTLRLHPAAGNNFDYEVGGEDLRLQAVLDLTGSILTETGSVKTRLNTLEAITGSILAATSSYALKADISGSGNVRFEALNAATSSYATKLGMDLVSGSGVVNAALSGSSTNTIRFTQQDASTIDVTINTGSSAVDSRIVGLLTESGSVKTRLNTIEVETGSINTRLSNAEATGSSVPGLLAITGSLIKNAALSGSTTNTIRFTQQDDSTIDITISTGSSAVDSRITGLLTESGSVKTRLNTIEAITGSILNATSSYLLNTTDTLTGNLTVTGIVTATSASFERLDTQIISSSVIYNSGSNIFGDSVNDKHIFSGSIHVNGGLDLGGGDARGNDISGAFWEGYVISASKVEGLDGYITGVSAGDGLTGGGSSGDVTVNVIGGDGITANANDIEVDGTVLRTTGDGVVSSSAQIDHDSTTNFVANEHIDHSTITIGSGKGLSGGGTIASNRSLSLDTGSAHFDEGVKKLINGDGVISSSAQIDHDSTTNFVAGEHFLQTAITTVGTVTTGNVNTILPGGIPSGSASQARSQIGAGTGDGTVDTSGSPIDNDYAKFTDSNTVEGRSLAEVRSDLNVEDGADVTDATNVKANMPSGVPSGSASQARSQIGAGTGNGTVDTSGSPVDNDFAKFTDSNTVEGRSAAEVRSDLGLGTIYSKDYTATVANGSGDIPDGDAVYDHVTSRLSGYVNKSGTPASQQIAIFTDADTISGSTNLKMHVNGSYPQFNGLQVGDGGTSNLYLGNAIEPNSANKGARFHSDDNDFYFDFQGDATQNWFLRDYDGSGGIHTRFTFDFINSNFSTNTATFTGNVTANNFVTTSDRELKKDIEPIKEGLSILKKFVSYEYELEGNKDAGFIAQEVQESLPYAVHKKDDGYLALDTKPILAHMHKAILEIDQRLSAIEEKLK